MLRCIHRAGAALALLVCSLPGIAQDAYLTNCFVPRYWKANTAWTLEARVRNLVSGAPLTAYRIDWRYNNGAVQTGNWQNSTGINPGQYMIYTHPIAFNQPAASGTLKLWVVGIGDTNHANDTLTFPVNVLAAWATKSVLLEQYTGTWCQWCPPPNATTNSMDSDPLVVVAKHHNMDEFSDAASTAYWVQFGADYSPSGVMEQEEFGTLQDDAAYDQWPARADQRKQGVSPVLLTVSATVPESSRTLTVSVSAQFMAAQPGDYVLNAYVLEDGVPGPQTNAPAGYVHNQVVRAVLGGAAGTTGAIPANPGAGTYAHQYTFDLPEAWDMDHLRVAAMVTERRAIGSWTVNVGDADVVMVGVPERDAAWARVWPNPSSGALVVATERTGPARYRVQDAAGRVVLEGGFAGQRHVLADFETLVPGLYAVRVEQAGAVTTHRVVRER
jgi:hypothetical protein